MNSLKLLLATCLVAVSLSPMTVVGSGTCSNTPTWMCQSWPFLCNFI